RDPHPKLTWHTSCMSAKRATIVGVTFAVALGIATAMSVGTAAILKAGPIQSTGPVNIGSGSAGALLEVQGNGNQLSLDSIDGSAQWEFANNGDKILDLWPNLPATGSGAYQYRFWRHTAVNNLGSGTDFQLVGTLGNTPTASW